MKVEANANGIRLRKLTKLSACGCEKSVDRRRKVGESGGGGVTVNLLMCERRGAFYSVHITV
jgi:hypothetical protein